jgi:hypothetical protein
MTRKGKDLLRIDSALVGVLLFDWSLTESIRPQGPQD